MSSSSHDEFRELCALSTTGELTPEEWRRLEEHLTICHECRETRAEYEEVISGVLPELAAGSDIKNDATDLWSVELAEAYLMKSLHDEDASRTRRPVATSAPTDRKYLYGAAASLLLAASAFAAYRAGLHGRSATTQPAIAQPQSNAVPLGTSSVSAAAPKADDKAVEVKNRLNRSLLETDALRLQKDQLTGEVAKQKGELADSFQAREDLGHQLERSQIEARTVRGQLDSITGQRSQDAAQLTALQARIRDLGAALQEKDHEIAEKQELMQRDRDVRNLMSARNLYIAEIYDVANGGTQKPFGRMFYTKDKSLILYGYDLDQQPGAKQASFQVWGHRSEGKQSDISLGILYIDDSSKSRWALKVNDATALAQLDAVFVTVEPTGGSVKPSGKPILFTYLRIEPNHP